MKKYKWQINTLKKTKSLSRISKEIISHRIIDLHNYAEQYLNNPSENKLHLLRISLRRIRYSMELFLICFDKKIFFKVYREIEKLQDLSGAIRDLDVMQFKLNNLSDYAFNQINKDNHKTVFDDKTELELKFKKKLNKFLVSKYLTEFSNKLSK